MLFHQLLDQRQPDAETATRPGHRSVRLHEQVEDMFLLLPLDSDPIVHHAHEGHRALSF